MILLVAVLTYLSFGFDFLVYKVGSEASSRTLSHEGSGLHPLVIWLIFGLNLTYYLLPGTLIIWEGISTSDRLLEEKDWAFIIVLVLGRVLSIVAARRLSHANCLIRDGLFRWSRNPITLGMHLTLFGLILLAGHYELLLLFPLYLLNFHIKIRIEEAYLHRLYGETYARYCAQTRRYL